MKSFKESLLKEERRGTETEEETFESSLGPLGFRTLNKKMCKKKEKNLKFFSLITSKNEALRKLNLSYT